MGNPGGERESASRPADESSPGLPVRSGRFAVVGDLQPTSRLEIWRESNAAERERIVRDVAAAEPDFVALLGDLVFCGSSAAQWGRFDRLCSPFSEAGMRLFPVLGNHEYWWSRSRALRHFFARFPHLEERNWYALRYGPLGLAFLDSNRRRMPASSWREQLRWFDRQLSRDDRDPSVRAALVFLHHPPFTNSTLTSDERHVQRFFLPALSRSRKATAMISGHVHSYERFEREGKVFVVAGGGGGPRARLAAGDRRRHRDELFDGPPVRFFHYLVCTLQGDGLAVEVRGLEKNGDAFVARDRFHLPWPETGPRGAS